MEVWASSQRGGWSPASLQKVLPESLGTPALLSEARNLAPVGVRGRRGLRVAQAALPLRPLQVSILSKELGQAAHWTIPPLWWAGRDPRSQLGVAVGSQAPPPHSQVGWALVPLVTSWLHISTHGKG